MGKLKIGLLLENYVQERWIYEMVKKIVNSDYAEVALVIIANPKRNDVKPDRGNFINRILANRNQLFYILYRRFEDKFNKCEPNAFELTDITPFLNNVKRITVDPISTKFSDKFPESDLSKIRSENLDVILRLGFKILRGDILTSAKYGIWSFHHGDNNVHRGGPSGFWEVFTQQKETGVVLQILTEDLDGGIVIDRSFSCTDSFSVNRNRNNYFWKALSMVPRNLRKLHELGIEEFMAAKKGELENPQFYYNRLFVNPTNSEVINGVYKLLIKKIVASFKWRFYFNQWILLYRFEKKANEPSTSFFRYKKIFPPKDRFWADPFIVFENNIYYIFIEELLYKSKKGHISFFMLNPDGKMSLPEKIIEENYHLSYPFVFKEKNNYYMIPESMANGTIELYKCTQFPERWEKVKVMIDGINAVDATLFFYENKYWLFVNIRENEGASEWDELFLFYSDDFLTDSWISHPQNPIVSDVKKARPAGRIFKHNEHYYRPSQDCSGHYGRGICINKIVILNEKEYKEEVIQFMYPDWDKKMISTHTLNFENKLSIIDGLYQRKR